MRASDPTMRADVAPKPAPAHVRRTDDGSFEIHNLEDHVRAVGNHNFKCFG